MLLKVIALFAEAEFSLKCLQKCRVGVGPVHFPDFQATIGWDHVTQVIEVVMCLPGLRHTLTLVERELSRLDHRDTFASLELPRDVQQEALGLLIDAACADGKVVEEERSYLHTVGAEIGMARKDIDARIEVKLEGK